MPFAVLVEAFESVAGSQPPPMVSKEREYGGSSA
jgi:hypothetical protein